MYVSSGIEIPFAIGLVWPWPCWEARAVRTRAAAAQRVQSRLPYVYGISKNNAFSGHILPNYAASLKYAFSAGIIRQTLLHSSGTILHFQLQKRVVITMWVCGGLWVVSGGLWMVVIVNSC